MHAEMETWLQQLSKLDNKDEILQSVRKLLEEYSSCISARQENANIQRKMASDYKRIEGQLAKAEAEKKALKEQNLRLTEQL